MKLRICPICKSEAIILDAAGHTGKYRCKDCNYIGVLILEKSSEKESQELP